MSLLEKADNEVIEIANPIWANLVKSSNMKDYGGFTKDFSSQMLYGANEVELGKQWASNDLISSLSSIFAAFFIVGQSDFEPIIIATNALDFFIKYCISIKCQLTIVIIFYWSNRQMFYIILLNNTKGNRI